MVMVAGQSGYWRVVGVTALVLTLEGSALAAGTRAITVPGPHGGLTVVHGGGNSLLRITGQMAGGSGSLTRGDGLAWYDDGFRIGQVVQLDGESVTRTVLGFANHTCPPPPPGETGFSTCGIGAILLLSGGAPASGERTIHVAEPRKAQATTSMNISVQPAVGAGLPTSTLTRYAGSFLADGFTVGMKVWVSGIAGPWTIAALSASTMVLQGAALTPTLTGLNAPLGAPVMLTVFGFDPTLDGGVRIGGDTIRICSSVAVDETGDPVPCGSVLGGPNSPLVVYGDTSQDGVWYSGHPYDTWATNSARSRSTRSHTDRRRERGRRVGLPAGRPVRLRRSRRHRRLRPVRRPRRSTACRASASPSTAARATT